MVTQIQTWRWRLDREQLHPGWHHNEFGINELQSIVQSEIAAAEKVISAFENHNVELPRSLWRGARLISNGLKLRDRNPSLAKSQIHKGLEEYDEGRSVLISEKVSTFHEMLARGSMKEVSEELARLIPRAPDVPYPEELEDKNPYNASDETRLVDLVETAKGLSATIASSQQTRDDLIAVDKGVSELMGRLEGMEQEVEEKINQIELSFRESLALSKPISFWSGRVEAHRTAKWIWFALLVAALSMFVVAGVEVISSNWATLLTLHASSLPILALLLGVPTAVILWAIRIVARIYRNEAAMYDDALERQTMLQTYIAMLAGGDMHVEDRDHVLRAVFRPRTIDSMDDGGASPIAQVVQAFRDDNRKERS